MNGTLLDNDSVNLTKPQLSLGQKCVPDDN